MAGLGAKTFAAGDVLTATDVNGYLMQQAVAVFATTGARTTAIPSPSAGMTSYITGTNTLEAYNGSAWVAVNSLGAWTAYTPAISGGASPAWTIGNGTIAGSYAQIGKTVHFKGSLAIGSTTTVGNASLTITLPVTSAAADANSVFAMTGTGRANLTGLATTGNLVMSQVGTTTFAPQLIMTAGTLSLPTSRSGISTTNYTRTATDLIIFTGTYESA